jgi:hypothetical protein
MMIQTNSTEKRSPVFKMLTDDQIVEQSSKPIGPRRLKLKRWQAWRK